MIKLDIINEVVNRTGITKTKAEMAVETAFETMKKALALALIAFVVTGCNTISGVGKDVQKAGAVVEGAARK